MTTPSGSAPSLDEPHRRLVFDTNVLVSAALFGHSIPRRALDYARTMGSILTTVELATELSTVLGRPKFARYISAELRNEFLVAFFAQAEFVQVIEHIEACRDPDDNQVLDAAVNGRATAIISGDNDLLTLTPFRGVAILRPGDYLAQMGIADS